MTERRALFRFGLDPLVDTLRRHSVRWQAAAGEQAGRMARPAPPPSAASKA